MTSLSASVESVSPVAQPPAPEGAALTPMLRQYLEVKAQVPGAILFFRLGDFYEMFFDDAVKASELLQITLTSRAKGSDRVPMCGVPYHAARRYISRLVDAGLNVAICDQVEQAGGKTIVRREVVRVVTPGMVLDEESLDARSNNFFASLLPPKASDGLWGAALLDVSTGEFVAREPASFDAVAEWLGQVAPKELLVPDDAEGDRVERLCAALAKAPVRATLPRDAFEPRRADAYLRAHFSVKSLDGFGLADAGPSVGAAAAALRYVRDTQKSAAAHVDRVRYEPSGQVLLMDESSRANLELVRSLKDGSRQGTLLGVLDATRTSPGARKLARWITAPLCDVAGISARLDAVEELVRHASLREGVSEGMASVADMERLAGRLALRSGGPRDLLALGQSLRELPALARRLKEAKSPLLKALIPGLTNAQAQALGNELGAAIVDEPPVVIADGGFIRAGYNNELDGYVALSNSGKDTLLKLEAKERERTGINSLKVRYNRVSGYYLEVTRANLHLVPKDYVRKQTMTAAERFATPQLEEYEVKVLGAEEKRVDLEQKLFEALKEKVVACAAALRTAADAVATLDVLTSFARVSAQYGYVRPSVDDGVTLNIRAGRHPVVERMLKGEVFVPNDVCLSSDDTQVLIITGPNMAGKSTVMRQTALIAIMAQAGCFVPAASAHVGLCDRVFTRVGASDNLARGQSTFMVEMTETANILHHATGKSLVILDEIGRGTSTFDGLSIAWAVAEHLHDKVGARTLFATHYHELVDLAADRPRVKNVSVAVREQGAHIIFLRKLVSGGASRSYGIEVARLAGLPAEVVKRARELLKNLESNELDEAGKPRLSRPSPDSPQMGLFAGKAPLPAPGVGDLIKALESFSVEASSPLEALNAIAAWKALLKRG